MDTTDHRLARALVVSGLCRPEDVEDALKESAGASSSSTADGARLGQVLIRKRLLAPADLARVLREIKGDTGTTTAPLPAAPRPRASPDPLGHYEVLGELGRGGMGVVYRARHTVLDRVVALKVLLHAEPDQVERFAREARVIARLSHENVVRVHEWGEDGQRRWFAMDLVEGRTLQDLIAQGPLPPRRALEVVATIARAVDHAHREGVVHRDLKPSNVLVGDDGVLRVADFGLARAPAAEVSELTRTGAPIGTPYYMSPEQFRADPRAVDHRTDVWALGVILYECLTGRRPYAGRNAFELFERVREGPPPPPSRLARGLDPRLDDVCARALALDPEARYPSAAALAEALEFRPSRRSTRRERVRPQRRSKTPLAIAATLAAVAAVAIALAAIPSRGPTPSSVPPPVPDPEADPPPAPELPAGMVLVPAGPFVSGERDAPRELDLPAFAIDRTEVTIDEYARYLGALPPRARQLRFPSYSFERLELVDAGIYWLGLAPPPGRGTTPVTFVTYEDARRYAWWAGKRLPTAAEWEKAARGPDGRRFPWGDDLDETRALLASSGATAPGPVGSHPAGASPYGALDLAGNVWEWTSSAPRDGSRLVKGGAFDAEPDRALAAYGEPFDEARGALQIGFRCARSILPPAALEDLPALLDDPDPGVRAEAARLASTRPADPAGLGRALLAAALEDPDETVRRFASDSLARHLDPALAARLVAVATDRLAPRRREALRAAARILPAADLAPLAPVLAEPAGDHLVEELLERPDPVDGPPWRQAFERRDSRLRAAALLAAAGVDTARAHLVETLAADDPRERLEAARLLWRLGEVAPLLPLLELHSDRPDLIPADELFRLFVHGPFARTDEGLAELRRGLDHPRPEVRGASSRWLGMLRVHAARADLDRVAQSDPHELVRQAAAWAAERAR